MLRLGLSSKQILSEQLAYSIFTSNSGSSSEFRGGYQAFMASGENVSIQFIDCCFVWQIYVLKFSRWCDY